MPAIKLEQFGGELPAWAPELLPTGQAAQSVNGYLFSGNLQGWRQPKLLRNLTNPSAKYAYRIPTLSETQALAYLVFVFQPNDGDQITVGDDTYTYRSILSGSPIPPALTPPGLPFEILIGASTLATAINTVAALTVDYGLQTSAGITYGQNTTPNSSILTIPPEPTPPFKLASAGAGTVNISGLNFSYVIIGAPDFGAAFNSINVGMNTSAMSNLLWLSDLLSESHTTSYLSGGSNPSFTNSITGAASWLEFLDQDTNVLKSQVADDQFDRFYIASPSQYPQYNTRQRIVAGMPAFNLGIPAPGCAPDVTAVGGGSSLTTLAIRTVFALA